MTKMKALKAFKYGSRRLTRGDTFEANGSKDAKLLIAIGKAERNAPSPIIQVSNKVARVSRRSAIEVEPPPMPVIGEPNEEIQAVEVVDVQDESAIEATGADTTPRQRRTYRRRDMTSKDE